MTAGGQDSSVADAVRGHWVDTRAPEGWRPYLRMMRAERPIGWRLLVLPCWQGLVLAIGHDGRVSFHDLWLALAFLIGAIAMRGAGCCLNDIADRDIDAQVARTRSRPIPSGAVTVKQAILFMGALCLGGLCVLLSMNRTAILVALASVVLAVIYPFMKRITYWPQLFLGLAFNWGALVGWAAHTGALAWPAALLYAGGICWTIGYDTIYAHMDKQDDIEIGVKSTALRFGSNTKLWLTGFYGGAVMLAGAAGWSAGLGWAFWPGLVAYAAHLGWQLRALDIDEPQLCLRLFRSNWHAGLILLAAIALGALL